MWTIFKVFIEFVTVLLLFYIFCLVHEACGILALQPRIGPLPPARQVKVLTLWTTREVPSLPIEIKIQLRVLYF